MIDKGWVCVHRKLLEWEWYGDINVSRLFLHLLLKANFEDKKWQGKVIRRGDLVTSRSKLSTETGLSERQIRTALTKLKSTSEITIQTTNEYTKITLCNYSLYQDKSELEDQQNNQPKDQRATTKRPTSDQRATTTKQLNNSTMEQDSFLDETAKKAKPKKSDISLQEFYEKTDRNDFKDFAKNFMFEKKYDYENAKLEFEGFENHWQANGKKYKDWHAVFRKWVTSPYSRLSKNIHTATEKDKTYGQQAKPSKFISAVTSQYTEFAKRHGIVD